MIGLLASLTNGDVNTLFVVLAFVAFALAILAGFRGALEACVVLAVVGLLILLFA